MKRRVWSVDELAALLRAVAIAGGDPRTLAILAAALGLPVGQDRTPDGPRVAAQGEATCNRWRDML